MIRGDIRMYQDERKLDFRPIGKAIKSARDAKGWTQEQLAQLVVPAYEINIIQDDNDFILKKFSLITNRIRPIVNMLLGKNGTLVNGCVICLALEQEDGGEQELYE